MRSQRQNKKTGLWKVLIADILAVGVILLTFAFFHHVLPRYLGRLQLEKAQMNATEPVTEEVETFVTETEPEQTLPIETEPATEPDPRTPWQIKFADKFTDEVVITKNSYTSQEISITIEKVRRHFPLAMVTYYVADVYIAGIENFKTYTAYDEFIYYGTQDPIEMSNDTNAVLAVNGDFATLQKAGFAVRNSEVLLSDVNNNICVLYPDGTMEAYDQGTYDIAQILERNPTQVWSFGPSLLDSEGKARSEDAFEAFAGIKKNHPRCAIGYYEPGHYCFLVADGRQENYSYGINLVSLAQVFEELGCQMAYNLDGGQSAIMMFEHKFYNKPYGWGRDLGDILYIAESGLYTHDVEAFTEETDATEPQKEETE